MLRLALRIGQGLATEQECPLLVWFRWDFWENASRKSARAEAMTSRRAETVWRWARACSPVLAVMLRERLTEPLPQLAAEHFPEHFCELRGARLRLRWTAEVASGA